MFTCDECHTRIYGMTMEEVHFSFSRGACEWCHETHTCADCHCVAPNSTARPRSKRVDPIKVADEIREEFRRKP